MDPDDSYDETTPTETVDNTPEAKVYKRKWEWTDARRAAFNKCREARKKSYEIKKDMEEAQKLETSNLRQQVKKVLNTKEKMKAFLEKDAEPPKVEKPEEPKPQVVENVTPAPAVEVKKKRKKIVIVQSSDSSDSEEEIVVKKSKKKET